MLGARWPRLLLAVALIGGGAASARAAVRLDPLHNDSGTYRVYFRDRLLGTEKFSLEPHGDSVAVFSNVDEMIPTPNGDSRLDKRVNLLIKTLDYDLLSYQSEQNFIGHRLLRGVETKDTTLTAFRETNNGGAGETYLRPPGRMFVIDGQVFLLFDLMLRSLHGKMIGERPIPVFVLGEPRDSVLEITFRPGENTTVKVQGRTRTALQVSLTDGYNEFIAWLSPAGKMLRLDQPGVGLRVERVSEEPGPVSKTRKPVSVVKPSTTFPIPKPMNPNTPGGH